MTLEAVSRATEAEKKFEAQKNKSAAAAKVAQAALTTCTSRCTWQQLSKDSKAKVTEPALSAGGRVAAMSAP